MTKQQFSSNWLIIVEMGRLICLLVLGQRGLIGPPMDNWSCDKRLPFPNKYTRVVPHLGQRVGGSSERRRYPKQSKQQERVVPCRISSVTLDPEDKTDLCLLARRTEIRWVRVEGYHYACLTFLCGAADIFFRSSTSAHGKTLINDII